MQNYIPFEKLQLLLSSECLINMKYCEIICLSNIKFVQDKEKDLKKFLAIFTEYFPCYYDISLLLLLTLHKNKCHTEAIS